MAKMWDSGQDEEPSRHEDKHPGLQKSYHMNLADQMDQQAGGSAFPSFMRTPKGAMITVMALLIYMAVFGAYLGFSS